MSNNNEKNRDDFTRWFGISFMGMFFVILTISSAIGFFYVYNMPEWNIARYFYVAMGTVSLIVLLKIEGVKNMFKAVKKHPVPCFLAAVFFIAGLTFFLGILKVFDWLIK